MTIGTLTRLGGIALLLSGILATVGVSMHPHDSATSNRAHWLVAHCMVMAGGLLNLFGLMALYLVSANRLGLSGLVGFVLAVASLVPGGTLPPRDQA